MGSLAGWGCLDEQPAHRQVGARLNKAPPNLKKFYRNDIRDLYGLRGAARKAQVQQGRSVTSTEVCSHLSARGNAAHIG
jgi:hypothetical protein